LAHEAIGELGRMIAAGQTEKFGGQQLPAKIEFGKVSDGPVLIAVSGQRVGAATHPQPFACFPACMGIKNQVNHSMFIQFVLVKESRRIRKWLKKIRTIQSRLQIYILVNVFFCLTDCVYFMDILAGLLLSH
jgi:hypothetical protein